MPVVLYSKLCVHFIIIFKHKVSEFFVLYCIGGIDINGRLERFSTIRVVVFPVCRTCKKTRNEGTRQGEPKRRRAPISQGHNKTRGELNNCRKNLNWLSITHLCANTYHSGQCSSILKQRKRKKLNRTTNMKVVLLYSLENVAKLFLRDYIIQCHPKVHIVYRCLTDLSSDQCLFITEHIMKRNSVQRNK